MVPMQKLSDLVLEGRFKIVKMLIRDVVTKVVDTISNPLLHLAVINDYIEIASMLLERGANVNVPNRDGITLIEYAIKNKKNAFTIRLLLNYGANFTVDHKIGYTEIVKYKIMLSQHGVDVNSLNSSLLWLPVAKGDIKMVKLLLENRANLNKGSNRKILHAAVFCDGEQYSEIVDILLQNGFTINPEDVANSSLFYSAVRKGYLKIVLQLLKYDIDVNRKLRSNCTRPLHVAVKFKQEEIAKLLISYGADVNAKDIYGKTPIFHAIENADLSMTKILLNNRDIVRATPELSNVAQHDVDVNATDDDGRTPIHCIAVDYLFDVKSFSLTGLYEYNVYKEIVKLLLSRGANINAVDKFGYTTFEVVLEENYIKIVEALIEHVDVNATFKNGMTPLHCSVKNMHVEISKMLLGKGANVNAKFEKNNWTPLHYATYSGYRELIEVLLRCGARVDAKIIFDVSITRHGSIFKTHLADHYFEIFEVLIENGADINYRNEFNGKTVLYAAIQWGSANVVLDLLNFGADIIIAGKSKFRPLRLANEDTIIILQRHITKLKAASLYLSKQKLLLISDSYEMRDFENKCNEEISRMKSEYISNTSASFYDILSKHVSRLALYAGNNDILQALESDDYKIKFPIYASMIECNFKRGKRRKRFSKGIYPFFDIISKHFPEKKFPYVCSRKILSYLSEEDLRNVMLSFRKEDERKVLLEQGYRYFHFLFINIPGFLYKFTEKIFSYLNNDDLKNLVEACKSDKECKSVFPPLRSPN